MPRPTPTPDCTPATRNWPFGYSQKLRPHRRALATSASLAALLCAAALMPGSAEAACPAPVAGTVTVNDNTCANLVWGTGAGALPSGTNLVVNGTMTATSGDQLSANTTSTEVGNITVAATGILQGGSRTMSFLGLPKVGAITFESGSSVSGTFSTYIIDLRNTASIGGIKTSGAITAPDLAFLGGRVQTTNDGQIINGGITNEGTFNGGRYLLLGPSTVEGSITNSGQVNSSKDAFELRGVALKGDLSNTNRIGQVGQTTGIAFRVGLGDSVGGVRAPSSITGSVLNSGTIYGEIGFAISSTTVGGNISNSGTIWTSSHGMQIAASSTASVSNAATGVITSTSSGNGILISGGSTISGAVENHGTLSSVFSALAIQGASIGGNVTNAGGITSTTRNGILVQNATVTGTIANTTTGSKYATINAARYGITLDGTLASSAGALANSGEITAGWAGLFANNQWTIKGNVENLAGGKLMGAGDGISLTGTKVTGAISNAGLIEVDKTGILLASLNGPIASLSNSGTIKAKGETADGVSLTGTTLKGGIMNTGSVTAGRFGVALANAGAISTFDNLGTITGGSFGISATGTTRIGTLTNSQGGGNPAGGVTYSGTLPTNYNTVIDGQSYGQLFADAATLAGTTTFAISPLSGSVLPQTYSAVLTGVSAANLTNPDQKVHAFGNRVGLVLERQAGSDTTWDLVLKGIWTPFIGWDYPDVDPTVAALRANQQAINRIFAERSAALSAAAQYDCDRFDVNGFCIEIAGRASTVDGEAETAAVVNAAARLTPTLRLGFYLDQQASQTDSMVASGPGSVSQDYDMPLFGAYLGYAAEEDGTGLQARASTGYMAGDLDIRRGFLTQSEPASGSAALEAFYARATLGYGVVIGKSLRLTPYVGLDYTSLDRDGYSEGYDASETLFPITYDSYHDRLLSGLAGAEIEGLFREDAGYRAALGVAFDLARDANGYGGHSEIPGLETIDLSHDQGSRADIRPTGLAEVFFDPAPNQRISATAFAAQDAWSEDLQATGMIAYRFSF